MTDLTSRPTGDLLILSDSHGRSDRIDELLRRVRPAGILFAGDGVRDLSRIDLPCPLWAVRGNCDWMSEPLIIGGALREPDEEELLLWEGQRILLCHGHRWGVKSDLFALIAHAAEEEVDLVVFGHTHTPLHDYRSPGEVYRGVTLRKPLHVFNPGSLGAGHPATFGILTVRRGVPLLSHGEW